MSSKGSSVAPKERINIKYTTGGDGVVAEKELPLHLLVTGDFTKQTTDTTLDEREVVVIDKNNFNEVMSSANIELELKVANRLVEGADTDLSVHLKVNTLQDFTPDNIAKQVPELSKLLFLRESLVALKGPLGNKPAFRAEIEALLKNEATRAQLLKELDI